MEFKIIWQPKAAQGSPGFVEEFITYNISRNDPMLLTFFLMGVSQNIGPPKPHLAAK